VKYQVLTAADMKMKAFWDFAPCNLVGCEAARHSIPEGCHFALGFLIMMKFVHVLLL
jgi:hypothetical protein